MNTNSEIERLKTENSLRLHKISQLDREIEIYNQEIIANVQQIQKICPHIDCRRESSCGPCSKTCYVCDTCGVYM